MFALETVHVGLPTAASVDGKVVLAQDATGAAEKQKTLPLNGPISTCGENLAQLETALGGLGIDTKNDETGKVEVPKVISANKSSAKKRKKKRAAAVAALRASPAVTVVRGFTPAVSGDEDSDYSTTSTHRRQTPRLNAFSSRSSSPFPRPPSSCSHGGISSLKQQLDTLNIGSSDGDRRPSALRLNSNFGRSVTSSNTSTTPSTPRSETGAEVGTYEVPLVHDFVSSEADSSKPMYGGAVEGGLVPDSTRKISAEEFEPLRCLGTGAFGTVLLVRQVSTGRLFAQKQFKKASMLVRQNMVEQTKSERVILESVNRHPFVVKLYYAFQDHAKLYLILEYAQGGELFTHLATERMFSEEIASFYMAEMVLALEHLHRNVGVVYRDLKPENCLLDAEGHLLLADFGLSKVATSDSDSSDEGRCRTMAGTVEYMAPEVILSGRSDDAKSYGMAVDWWSFGVLGHDLLTGSTPFRGPNNAKTCDKILHAKLVMPYFLSADARDLLTRLLRRNPTKRLGGNMPRDLQTIKQHRFFRKIDWKKLARRELEPPIKPLITDPELAENFDRSFTEMPLSPVVGRMLAESATTAMSPPAEVNKDNPFGGFSFVASSSLLEIGNGYL